MNEELQIIIERLGMERLIEDCGYDKNIIKQLVGLYERETESYAEKRIMTLLNEIKQERLTPLKEKYLFILNCVSVFSMPKIAQFATYMNFAFLSCNSSFPAVFKSTLDTKASPNPAGPAAFAGN